MRLGLEIDEPQEVEGNFYYQLGSLHGILPYGNQTIMGYKHGKHILNCNYIFYTETIIYIFPQHLKNLQNPLREKAKERSTTLPNS